MSDELEFLSSSCLFISYNLWEYILSYRYSSYIRSNLWVIDSFDWSFFPFCLLGVFLLISNEMFKFLVDFCVLWLGNLSLNCFKVFDVEDCPRPILKILSLSFLVYSILSFFTILFGIYLSCELIYIPYGTLLSKIFVIKEFFVYELYFIRLDKGRSGLSSFGLNLDESLL